MAASDSPSPGAHITYVDSEGADPVRLLWLTASCVGFAIFSFYATLWADAAIRRLYAHRQRTAGDKADRTL